MGQGSSKVGGSPASSGVVSPKQFSDKPDDSGHWIMDYAGDGQEQIDFFRQYSNSYELMDEAVANDDERAFRNWASGDFMYGQQYGDFDDMSDRDKANTYALDQYLDAGTLSQPVTVCRGSTAELLLGAGRKTITLEEAQAMAKEHRIVKSKGAMSTGAASEGLPIDSEGRSGIEYRFNMPSGRQGVGMWIGDEKINPGWGVKQREFVTSRDSMFQVRKAYDRKGKIVVELDWVGQGEHDYGKGGKAAARRTYEREKK